MIRWLLFILIPFLLNGETIWQADLQPPFKLTIQLPAQQLTLADSLLLKAEFHYPSSYRLNSESLIDQISWSANPLASKWRVENSEMSSLPLKEDVQAQRLSLQLIPLTTGQLDLSFLTVTFLPKETGLSPVEVVTPIFSVDVLQSASATTLAFASLTPLDPQFPLGLTETNRALFLDNPQELTKAKEQIQADLAAHSFPWIILTVLLGCGGMGWVFYLMRDRWLKHFSKPVIRLSPKQEMDRDLQAFQKRPFIQEQAPAFYAELASLLQQAIQVRAGRSLGQLTTEELAQAVRKQGALSSVQTEETLSLLAEMDQVKFAGKKPSRSEVEQVIQQTQQLIKNLSE